MNSVKLPLAPIWRLFLIEGLDNWIILRWLHAGRPNLTPAEQYILDVCSSQHGDEIAGEVYWTFADVHMEQVSNLLIDAQDDDQTAITMAWLMFDPDVHRPTIEELKHRPTSTPKIVDFELDEEPHVARDWKGDDDAA